MIMAIPFRPPRKKKLILPFTYMTWTTPTQLQSDCIELLIDLVDAVKIDKDTLIVKLKTPCDRYLKSAETDLNDLRTQMVHGYKARIKEFESMKK